MTPPSLLDLVVGLSSTTQRSAIATTLAQTLGVETVLLFARDPSLDILIPAPGMMQTLRGGRSWRKFLAECPSDGRLQRQVELPMGVEREAMALLHRGCAMILLGGRPRETDLAELQRLLPMMAALLAAEQGISLAKSEVIAAQEAASRAHELAAALESARSEAAALNAESREEHRRKDEFLAMLGHELRNPLAPLVTALDLLRINATKWKVPEHLVNAMGRQTAQLARLVDDLLDVSRVSRGRIELRRENLNIAEVLNDALEESRPLLDSRRHHVHVEGLEQPLEVFADRARLRQVFGNLLNNTAKYTDEGGRIEITLAAEDDQAVVRIRDNGIGIAPEVLPQVFDLFAQASPALGRAEGGLGIGLTLVRSLIELHEGRVAAESPGVGQGATFTVALPCTQPVSAQSAASAEGAAPGAIPADDKPAQVRVLIVDDNRDAADSMAILLRMMGHDAEVAYDGHEALQLDYKQQADLILLDIGLPGMDGYEVARKIRPSVKDGARLIALTGYGTEEGKRRSREAGFDAHVVKPVTTEILQDLLTQCAANRSGLADQV